MVTVPFPEEWLQQRTAYQEIAMTGSLTDRDPKSDPILGRATTAVEMTKGRNVPEMVRDRFLDQEHGHTGLCPEV